MRAPAASLYLPVLSEVLVGQPEGHHRQPLRNSRSGPPTRPRRHRRSGWLALAAHSYGPTLAIVAGTAIFVVLVGLAALWQLHAALP